MKYYILLIISIIGLYVFGTLYKTEYTFILKITFTVLAFICTFLWEYSVLNKHFESDFKCRSEKKTFEIFQIGNAIAWSFFILFDSNKDLQYFIFILWIIPFTELIIWFIYKSKKPYTLFIKENTLILNRRHIEKRKLNELVQIKYNRFSKNLKLDFESEREVSIKTTEYKPEAIKNLLAILIEKSRNPVFIPENYESRDREVINNA